MWKSSISAISNESGENVNEKVIYEFHYLFICSDESITQSRLENLDKYYVDRPDNYKFKQ
jgi:hypothetical protein